MKIEISRQDLIYATAAFTSLMALIIVIALVKRCKTRRMKPSKRQIEKMPERVQKNSLKVNSLMSSVVKAKKEQLYKQMIDERPTLKKDINNSQSHFLQEPFIKNFRYEVSLESYSDGSSSKDPSGVDKMQRVTHVDFLRDIDKESYAKEQLRSLRRKGVLDDEDLKKRKVVVYV